MSLRASAHAGVAIRSPWENLHHRSAKGDVDYHVWLRRLYDDMLIRYILLRTLLSAMAHTVFQGTAWDETVKAHKAARGRLL